MPSVFSPRVVTQCSQLHLKTITFLSFDAVIKAIASVHAEEHRKKALNLPRDSSRNLSLCSLQHDALHVLRWSICTNSWPLFSKARTANSKASPIPHPQQLSEYSTNFLNSFPLIWDNYSPIFVLPFLNNSYKLLNDPLGCHWSLPGNCAG